MTSELRMKEDDERRQGRKRGRGEKQQEWSEKTAEDEKMRMGERCGRGNKKLKGKKGEVAKRRDITREWDE